MTIKPSIPNISAEAARKRAAKLLRGLIPQILIQSIAIVVTAIGSYMLMTWLIVDVADVKGTYLSTMYETLGTLFLMVIVLVSTNTYMYRKRLREINTLAGAISKVASGDFDYRIQIKPKEPMAQIYDDFNKMSAELSSVQLLRNDFINSYSHEFKTPIASINGFADLLLEKKLSERERRQYLEIIRDESERLTSLAKNTIMLSKLSSQHIVDKEHYDLGEQLRQCAIICSGQWMDKKQEFSGEFPEVQIDANRELLQHLWLNLIGNAIKYTHEEGTISVKLEERGGAAVITVADNGEGMTKETQKHLFQPYYQGDSSRSVQGLGLGLSIASRIAEMHGGSITVKSELGVGSEFVVKLPIKG